MTISHKTPIGATVKLKSSVNHACPEGRENNATATVEVHLSDVDGGLKMDRDLHGCSYWNDEDVEVVEEWNATGKRVQIVPTQGGYQRSKNAVVVRTTATLVFVQVDGERAPRKFRKDGSPTGRDRTEFPVYVLKARIRD